MELDYHRILELIEKRHRDNISEAEFMELNSWIYGDVCNSRDIYALFSQKEFIHDLQAVVDAMALLP